MILTAERNGRRFREGIQPPGQLLAQDGEALFIEFVGAVEHHRRQHLKSGIEQHPVLNGEQNVVDRPVNSTRSIVLRPSAGGNDQHRPFTRERAFAVAIAPVRIAVLADAVGKPVSVNPINPAFHDGGQ